jgi:ribonucleoside-triphosphate reductase
MNPSNKLLSDIVAFRTYSRFLPHLGRRELLEETINRWLAMHLDRFPKLSRDIIKAGQKVHEGKIMPSMRALQFAGDAITKNNVRQYNCSFINVDDVRVFGEILFVLLSGSGVGYSVQGRHISALPRVGTPPQEGRFIIQDSILGWAQAVNSLMESYFFNAVRPQFDFSTISPKGTYLFTTGAKAPGPEPLRYMLVEVEKRLKAAAGRKLRSIEVHDIICLISDCVLAGGIRRAALIALFDRNDSDMLKCKSGEWWVKHPYRARANNSVVMPRDKVSKEEFLHIFKICQESGSGEPGISWTDNEDMGFNPCHEIALHSTQFCNLSTVNQTGLRDKRDFMARIYSAALIGTLQAAYTDFPFLRPQWKRTTEREALIGVSFTGIADSPGQVTPEWLREGAGLVLEVNEKYAKKLGINIAARCTAVKPEGTSSTVLGSSSGIHDRHSKYYLRRIRMNKDDALAGYLSNVIPALVEEDVTSSSTVVVTIPQESPDGAYLRENSTALSLFERAISYNDNWVQPGHRSGDNTHNVSCTISVRDNEWYDLAEAMWKKRPDYSGISLLPYDGGTYKQAPFEACDKETFDKYSELVTEVNLKEVREESDQTDRMETLACAGGVCEIR